MNTPIEYNWNFLLPEYKQNATLRDISPPFELYSIDHRDDHNHTYNRTKTQKNTYIYTIESKDLSLTCYDNIYVQWDSKYNFMSTPVHPISKLCLETNLGLFFMSNQYDGKEKVYLNGCTNINKLVIGSYSNCTLQPCFKQSKFNIILLPSDFWDNMDQVDKTIGMDNERSLLFNSDINRVDLQAIQGSTCILVQNEYENVKLSSKIRNWNAKQ